MRCSVAVAVAGLALLAGCSSEPSGGASGTAPRHGMSVNAADPCAGAPAGCARVGNVDIDADGVLDPVGISVQRQPPDPGVEFGPAAVTVRVATARGVDDLEVGSPGVLPKGGAPNDVFVGAFPISRARGADLVMHTRVGAGNSDEFAVIAWRDGKLVLVPRPPELHANYPDKNVWYLQESEGTREWVTCQGGGAITLVKLSAPQAEGVMIPGGGIRESDHWTFADGAWSPAGSENVADDRFSYHYDPHVDTFQCHDERK